MPEVTQSSTAFETPWFPVVVKTVNGLPGMDDGAAFYAIKPQDYVTVVAVTEDHQVLLVRQYRPVVEDYTLEFPSGLLEEGELPADAARRELEEETGYTADTIEYLGCLVPDTGRLANRMWCFFAGNARKATRHGRNGEAGVELRVCTLDELNRSIAEGSFSHALHLGALQLASAKQKISTTPASIPARDKPATKRGELRKTGTKLDVCVVGGAGHVGLPLSLVLADSGMQVLVYDINESSLATIRCGEMPFLEKGAPSLLKDVLSKDRLTFTSDPTTVADAPVVIVTIGTPVDEFLNPDTKVIRKWADEFLPHLSDDQLLILRSTVYPGTTDWLDRYLRSAGRKPRIAFCPERIVQGMAIDELKQLPQIVSGTTPEAEEAAVEFWSRIAPDVVRVSPLEAEFAKLFCNAYRYIQFAAANQMYMIASSAGVDYSRVVDCLKKNYPRMRDFPKAGFAAGPCLLKDTMQLAAFAQNDFPLGHAAMLVNEGLVLFLVGQLEKRFPLEKMTVGLLGMAFKSGSDDTRSSLSYKLKKLLQFRADEVLTTDPYVTTDRELLPCAEVVRRSDLLILCTPHREYLEVDFGTTPVIDVWGLIRSGALVQSGIEAGDSI